MKNRKKVFILIILLVVIISAIGLWSFWEVKVKSSLIDWNTQTQMFHIIMFVDDFVKRENRLPVSLEEVVKAGDLPENDILYYCPMKHYTVRSKKLRYTLCEYELFFEPNEVKICIPEKVFYQKKFKDLPKQNKCGVKRARCVILTKDGELSLE
jgi:hypothetical protein